jgi:hypothetical protein
VSAEQSALIITACRLETLVPQLRLAPVVLEGCRPRVAWPRPLLPEMEVERSICVNLVQWYRKGANICGDEPLTSSSRAGLTFAACEGEQI